VPCGASPSTESATGELGHIAWFEEYWLARNPQRLRGAAADPTVARAASLRPNADTCYDSSHVAHQRRWHLDLPDANRTREYLVRVRDRTLTLLDGRPEGRAGLYFSRLALFHEDMHTEAWAYMAQRLGLACAEGCAAAPRAVAAAGVLNMDAGPHRAGWAGAGFAFDNELRDHEIELPAFTVDRAPVTWAGFVARRGGRLRRASLVDTKGWDWQRQCGPAAFCAERGRGWERAYTVNGSTCR
jgi:formylglycine-generating enzyme required for sulfatase activity